MRRVTVNGVFLSLAALLVYVHVPFVEASEISPHTENGDCSICHVAPTATLRSWFAFGSTKREMKADLNQLCLDCHTVEPDPVGGTLGIGIGHATGKKTAINRLDLPLSHNGTINCATTCHDMHVISHDSNQQRKHLRLPFNSLCRSCHDN